MLNSLHAYNQNKAFTKHIVDGMMKSFEEKHELEVSIPRNLYDEWEPTIKIKIKDYECHALCDLDASVGEHSMQFQKFPPVTQDLSRRCIATRGGECVYVPS